ncbi:hypothetical protein Hanom_Chr08g00735191 [Helianthus anomalus]
MLISLHGSKVKKTAFLFYYNLNLSSIRFDKVACIRPKLAQCPPRPRTCMSFAASGLQGSG